MESGLLLATGRVLYEHTNVIQVKVSGSSLSVPRNFTGNFEDKKKDTEVSLGNRGRFTIKTVAITERRDSKDQLNESVVVLKYYTVS